MKKNNLLIALFLVTQIIKGSGAKKLGPFEENASEEEALVKFLHTLGESNHVPTPPQLKAHGFQAVASNYSAPTFSNFQDLQQYYEPEITPCGERVVIKSQVARQSQGDLPITVVEYRGEIFFKCPKCPSTFKNVHELKGHECDLQSIPEATNVVKNSETSQGIAFQVAAQNETIRQLHKQIKASEKNQNLTPEQCEANKICPTCGKIFAPKSKMLRHQTVHTKARPFECLICHSRYTHQASLTYHLKTSSCIIGEPEQSNGGGKMPGKPRSKPTAITKPY